MKLSEQLELKIAAAQLRHAYSQLANPKNTHWEPKHRQHFADGLIAPQIRRLEELAEHPPEKE